MYILFTLITTSHINIHKILNWTCYPSTKSEEIIKYSSRLMRLHLPFSHWHKSLPPLLQLLTNNEPRDQVAQPIFIQWAIPTLPIVIFAYHLPFSYSVTNPPCSVFPLGSFNCGPRTRVPVSSFQHAIRAFSNTRSPTLLVLWLSCHRPTLGRWLMTNYND